MFMTVRFNFVIKSTNVELQSYKCLNIESTTVPGIFSRGDLSWCLQTYLALSKRNNLPVECSNYLKKECINIVHSDQLLLFPGTFEHFIVCVRADYPKRLWAHYHIVQNKNQLTRNTSYIQHWTQPGLIKRDTNRKDVYNVAYVGQTFNGNLAANIDTWKNLFEPYNINFDVVKDGAWHDLSKIDVLVGVRSFNQKPHDSKPPTKLLNSWHAHIPFIGGYDSAYEQIGVPGEDYIRVSSPEEVVETVLKLKTDKALYNKLVENGVKKTEKFSNDHTLKTWENVLSGPILKRYNKWLENRKYETVKFKVFLNLGLLEHKTKQIAKRIIKY
jgi:hypothetical protein